MRILEEAERIVAELPERIDTTNSENVSKDLDKVIKLSNGKDACLDASNTIYLSSSGLRIFMKLQKELGSRLSIINVSKDIYEIFSISGFSEILNIKRKIREISVDNCEIIGEGVDGTVYKLDNETVVKVYKIGEESLPLIELEQKFARQAIILGIPTAIPFDIVKVGEHYGVVFEMIDAQNCTSLIMQNPSFLDKLIPQYASFLKELHKIEMEPGQIPSASEVYLKNLDALTEMIGKEAARKAKALLERMPEERHIIHGDAHFKNIMYTGNEIKIIDMDNFSIGDPIFEFASLYSTYIAFNEDDPEDTLKFMGVPGEICDRIFYGTLKCYLKGRDVDYDKLLNKIRFVGYLRFLTVNFVRLKRTGELAEKRKSRVSKAVSELVDQVDNLCLFA